MVFAAGSLMLLALVLLAGVWWSAGKDEAAEPARADGAPLAVAADPAPAPPVAVAADAVPPSDAASASTEVDSDAADNPEAPGEQGAQALLEEEAEPGLAEEVEAALLALPPGEAALMTAAEQIRRKRLTQPRGDSALDSLLAARRLLGEGRRLEGRSFDAVLDGLDPAVREALSRRTDGLFTVGRAEAEEIYHLARRSFLLNGRAHELVMLRQLTAELRRQEVQTWKKVIRVISHELNNSLAPIASLAHSGAELLRRGQYQRLPLALATIEERSRHLEGFIHGYARFAKLPAPQAVELAWRPFIDRLASQATFEIELEPEDGRACFDAAQLEQALLNLLKNAHESGSAESEVRLTVRRVPQGWRIEVRDRGDGMSEAVLANALLPFYSTKRQGTGLGLALAREIIEAHGGRIGLGNRAGGGLCVSLLLPDTM